METQKSNQDLSLDNKTLWIRENNAIIESIKYEIDE